jgi:hypothetical protein
MKLVHKPEKGHQRYILKSGEEVKGASTIAKVDDETANRLMGWANSQGLKGINCMKRRDQHADAGTVGHVMIQNHFNRRIGDFKKMPQTAIDAGTLVFEKFMDWWVDNDLIWVASELELVSELYGFGGTIDLVAKDSRGRIWILDAKTSKAIYWGHKCQLAGCGQLWNENNEQKYSKLQIIRLPKEGGQPCEPRSIHNPEDVFQCFLAQLHYTNLKWKAGGYGG